MTKRHRLQRVLRHSQLLQQSIDLEKFGWPREYKLKRAGKLTKDEYQAMLIAQSCGCAICGRKIGQTGNKINGKLLCVDHCHVSGRVRGLLCSNCNAGIGMLGDDPARLRLAAAYLER